MIQFLIPFLLTTTQAAPLFRELQEKFNTGRKLRPADLKETLYCVEPEGTGGGINPCPAISVTYSENQFKQENLTAIQDKNAVYFRSESETVAYRVADFEGQSRVMIETSSGPTDDVRNASKISGKAIDAYKVCFSKSNLEEFLQINRRDQDTLKSLFKSGAPLTSADKPGYQLCFHREPEDSKQGCFDLRGAVQQRKATVQGRDRYITENYGSYVVCAPAKELISFAMNRAKSTPTPAQPSPIRGNR